MKPEPSDQDEESRARGLSEQCWLGPICLLIWVIVILGFIHGCAVGAQITLAWNPNPEPDIAGYIVRYGEESVSVGNVTRHTFDLAPGSYVFTVTAVNTAALISPPSDPVSYTVPATSAVTASTEAPAYPAANAGDGNPQTLYASFYEPEPATPQWLEIDLGEAKWVKGIKYLPRQDGWLPSGHLTGYQIYADGRRIAEGEIKTLDAAEKVILFSKTQARRWRLQSSLTHLTCAEISAIETTEPMVRVTLQESSDLSGWADVISVERDMQPRQFFRVKIEQKP